MRWLLVLLGFAGVALQVTAPVPAASMPVIVAQ